jgi:hypothetical protein
VIWNLLAGATAKLAEPRHEVLAGLRCDTRSV